MERRLYRSMKNRVLFGVFGGMGEYFNTDPVIIRVIAVVITVFTGFFPGIIAYLVMGLIIPEQSATPRPPPPTTPSNPPSI